MVDQRRAPLRARRQAPGSVRSLPSPPSGRRPPRWAVGSALAVGATAAAAAGLYAWGRHGAQDFTVRTEKLPVLPTGGAPIRVLHLSDIHLLPDQDRKLEWLSTLHRFNPDLIVNTGDNIASRHAVAPLLEALGPLLEVPGVFVPGSNDYFAPQPANPFRYLAGPSRPAQRTPQALPWAWLSDEFGLRFWRDLTNHYESQVVNEVRLDFAGTDDPHHGRDEWPGFSRPTTMEARAMSIGVTHAPYRRVLDAMVEDGADLIFAGHTHGGQVCVPGYGALVTNSDLPAKQASGLSTWRSGGRSAILQVSAGIGTSPYAPVRIACPPEAVVLDLVAPYGADPRAEGEVR